MALQIISCLLYASQKGKKEEMDCADAGHKIELNENVCIMIMVFSLYIRLLVSTGNNTVLHFARFLQNLMRSKKFNVKGRKSTLDRSLCDEKESSLLIKIRL